MPIALDRARKGARSTAVGLRVSIRHSARLPVTGRRGCRTEERSWAMSDNQNRSITDQEPSLFDAEVSRRRALELAGAGAAVVAAGLTAPAALVGAATSAAKVREFHSASPYVAPPQGHFNQYASDGNAITLGFYNDLLQMPMAKYKWASDSWVPFLATSWT